MLPLISSLLLLLPLASGDLLIDDFTPASQYNAQHTNDLGQWTDDDDTAALDAASDGGLVAVRAHGHQYWYSVLSQGCLDASRLTHLRLVVGSDRSAADFVVNLVDRAAGAACSGNHGRTNHFLRVSDYGSVGSAARLNVILIPLADFAAATDRLFNLALSDFTPGATFFVDEISFISAAAKLSAPSIVVDDFSDDQQYNWLHLNDLGFYSDDDAVMVADSVSEGRLMLRSAPDTYWFSILANQCLDAREFTHLEMEARLGNSVPSSVTVTLWDRQAPTAARRRNDVALSTYGALSSNWRTFRIPLATFPALNPSCLHSLAISNLAPAAEIQIGSLALSDNPSTPRSGLGAATWTYEIKREWLRDLRAYDSAVSDERRLRYVFPYADGVAIGPAGSRQFDVGYDTGADSVTRFYGDGLPSAAMYPNVDSGDGDAFRQWSAADMEWAAQKVASVVLADASVGGVHVNIEPFHSQHVTFYARLRVLLNGGGKRLTLFTGAADNAAVLAAADIVVFSGYDRGTFATAWSAADYGDNLRAAVGTLLDLADQVSGSQVLVGIPILTSTTEFESADCPWGVVRSGVSQEEYVRAAQGVLESFHCRGSFLGAAFWGFTTRTTWGRNTQCTFHRQDISQNTWSILTNDYNTPVC